MSTWMLFSDADHNFRWEIAGRVIPTKPKSEHEAIGAANQQHNSNSPLPSMTDLLRNGFPKILDRGNGLTETTPMFKTGLGKSVPLNKSSIDKALSLLNDDDDFRVPGEKYPRENGCGFANSLFQTGSGKMVDISAAGLSRAKTLFGLEQENDCCNSQHRKHTRTPSIPKKSYSWKGSSHSKVKEGVNSNGIADVASVPQSSSICNADFAGSKLKNGINPEMVQSEMISIAPKPPPIMFHTAGGRSLSVSSDALQHARSLLGDPELGSFFDDRDTEELDILFCKEGRFDSSSSNKKNDDSASFSNQTVGMTETASKIFTSPLRPSSNHVMSLVNSENIAMACNLIKEFDAVDHDRGMEGNVPSIQKSLCEHNSDIENTPEDGLGSKKDSLGRSSGKPLTDVTNRTGISHSNVKPSSCEKRRLLRSSISPFKRPRSSKFTTPFNKNACLSNGLSSSLAKSSVCKRTVSSRFPLKKLRAYSKEYFGMPPSAHGLLDSIPDQVRWMTSHNADEYTFLDESGLNCIGAGAFFHMLADSGASVQYASKEWVRNHYKWIVWKFACYERCYWNKFAGKFLTVSNVLEELKYRYDREVNYGHRSTIKKILEGDASPSAMMILCVSTIRSHCEPKIESAVASNEVASSKTAKVELTDGWYSVDACLDALLAKQLASRKLFVGQKLRIWGAGLCGWVGPVSPLGSPGSVSLQLNMNGTYRAHWGDRLGFCKGVGVPLAFNCIKSNGGPVPWTLAGVTRIYPVLYKERLSNGGCIVRSERMETNMMQLYEHSRSMLIEGIVSEFQRGNKISNLYNDTDSEEGAKILKILETAAEPEIIMAEMSPEQLTSFATYQAKMEATRQSHMEKWIEKALEDAGLKERDVTPFMRVRVVSLTHKDYQGKACSTEGIITIWNPTEKQQFDLVEGQAYAIAGLLPTSSDAKTLYLQAKGSTLKWQPLSLRAIDRFKPFFSPRRSILLSNLGQVSLSSEFDIAAYVVHVGEVYKDVHQKKQWVFVTDGSIPNLQPEELQKSLLAISFSSSYIDDESFMPINYNLVGSTVGFCNLIKKAKDYKNHLWVAEATESSTYVLSFDLPHCSHFKSIAASVQKWAKTSNLIIDRLKEKVLFITGNCNG